MEPGFRADRFAVARLLARVTDRALPFANRAQRFGRERTTFPDNLEHSMVARSRRTQSVVTQRLSQTPAPGGKNVKSKQAWKYPGYNIVRAPSVNINGRYYTDPKEADAGDALQQAQPMGETDEGTPRRKQESNFFITINPNIKFSDELAESAKDRFVVALQHISTVLPRCLKFGPKDAHYRNDIAHDVLIPMGEGDWKASVEVGENLGRMHAHIICYMQHYSQIQIDTKLMQYEFRMGWNGGGGAKNLPACRYGDPMALKVVPYLQVKMLPQSDWTTVMRQYIRKGMVGEQ